MASWSLVTCAACCDPESARYRTRPRARVLSLDYRTFDHAAAVRKLNASVRATNEALAATGCALSAEEVGGIASCAAAAGGLVVVSACDGKGSLLGALLRAGVRVRRYLSVENDHMASRVCECLYVGGHPLLAHGALRFFDDLRTLTVEGLKALDCWPVDLVAGGTPFSLAGQHVTRKTERSISNQYDHRRAKSIPRRRHHHTARTGRYATHIQYLIRL